MNIDLAETRQWIETRMPKDPVDVYILLGAYHAAGILAELVDPKRWIVCIENGPVEAQLPKHPRLRVYALKDLQGFARWWHDVLTESEAMTFALLGYPPVVKAAPEFYSAAEDLISKGIQRRVVEISTMIRHAERMESNAIANLASHVRARGVTEYAGRHEGQPAVLVGAGPSLNEAIPHLKAHREKVVVVAVSKAVRKLLAEGITPDYVAHLDMLKDSAACLEGVDLGQVPLVYDPDAYPSIAANHSGPLITYRTHVSIDKWAARFLGDFGTLPKGMSVSHTAYYFIRHMGCSPIIFTGVDCAFQGESTHASGVTMTWGGKTENAPLDWIEIPGASGKPVRSTKGFYAFVQTFESEIERTGQKVIQTAMEGAFIKGAEHKPIAEVLAELAIPDQAPPAPVQTLSRFNAVEFSRCKTALMREVVVLEAMCTGALRALGQIRHLDNTNKADHPKLGKLLPKVQHARKTIDRLTMYPALLGRLMSGAALETRKIARAMDLMDKSSREYFIKSCDQNGVIFQGWLDNSAFWQREFMPVAEQLMKETVNA